MTCNCMQLRIEQQQVCTCCNQGPSNYSKAHIPNIFAINLMIERLLYFSR